MCPYQTTTFNDVTYQLRLSQLRIFLKNDSTFRSVNYLWAGNGGYKELWMNLAKHFQLEVDGLLVRLNIIVIRLNYMGPWVGRPH